MSSTSRDLFLADPTNEAADQSNPEAKKSWTQVQDISQHADDADDDLELQHLTNTSSVSDRRKRWRMAAKARLHDNAATETGSDAELGVPAAKNRGSSGSVLDMSSQRSSMESRMSNVDMAKMQSAMLGAGLAGDVGENKEQEQVHTHGADGYIKSVIPSLPMWMALICLMLNICMPGIGTILSGFSVFCCGSPRVSTKDDPTIATFCVNVAVGLMQLFTVSFMLVGWFWSVVWGIYMIILAVEHRREMKGQQEKELQAKALTALNSNIRPWTLQTK